MHGPFQLIELLRAIFFEPHDYSQVYFVTYNPCTGFCLQTGEIYYKNRKTGIKVTEDPRTTAAEDDRGSYDRQGSSSESTASSSTDRWSHKGDRFVDEFTIFVAVGCKECLMYYMVPKLSKDCPRCHGPLLRF